MSTPARANGHAAPAETLEQVVVAGDLSKLTPAQRLEWYQARCEAAGLDPRTQPFQYLSLQGRLTLYATRAATDSLIASRKLTVEILDRRYDETLGAYEVRCRVTFPDGHHVEDLAAIPLSNLRGEALCNAVMKCVTKAKRRTVLSACGLGMLDESEVESIPQARVERAPEPPRKAIEPPLTPSANESFHKVPPVLVEPRPISDVRRWIQDRLDRANADWATTCALSRKDYEPLAKHVNQVVHGLISMWVEGGEMEEEVVCNDAGKRDKDKVGALLKETWDADPDAFQGDVEDYLQRKLEEAAKAIDINLDAEPAEPEPAETTADG
jgi:hypothetical protein